MRLMEPIAVFSSIAIFLVIICHMTDVDCFANKLNLWSQKQQRGTNKRARNFQTALEQGLSFANSSGGDGRKCGQVPAFDWSKSKAGAFCDENSNLPPAVEVETLVQGGQFPSLVIMNVTRGDQHKACTAFIVHEYMVVGSYRCLADKLEGATFGAAMLVAGDPTLKGPNVQVRYAWGFCRLRISDKLNGEVSVDIAVMQLRDPFIFNDFVQPACMAIEKPPREGAQCYAIRNRLDASCRPESLVPSFVPIKRTSSRENLFKDTENVCYEAPVSNPNADHSREGSPIYCIDSCDKNIKHWVVGMDILSWRTNGGTIERIAAATLYKLRQKFVYYLTNCHETTIGP